ncbi:SCO3933 family regulatory protein [Kitasatospora sp. NPDC001664]
MATFKIDTSTAFVFVVVPPAPKLVSKQTGEVAIDRETGARMLTVGLTIADEGEANLYTVAVPETGVSEGLGIGMPVALTGLRARSWENEFNGHKRHGISFRAAAVTSLVPAASNG